jgi:hypothetical protein
MTKILKDLVNRGYFVAIDNGCLQVKNKNGREASSDWLNQNSYQIVSEVAQLFNQSIYLYSHYDTGNYLKGIASGVRVALIDLSSGEDVFAIFNAELKRKRNTKAGKAGASLPKGMFNIGTRSSLYKFWLKTGLAVPRRPSEMYKSMSKLKTIYLSAERTKGSKLSNSSFETFSCDSQTICKLLSDNSWATHWQNGGNFEAHNGDNELGQRLAANNGVNGFDAKQRNKELSANLNCVSIKPSVLESKEVITACTCNYEQSFKEITNKVPSTNPDCNKKIPQEQTTEEWLLDYDSASNNQ